MLPADQIRALVDTDPGEWSRTDLDRLADRLGWRADGSATGPTLRYDTGGTVEVSAFARSASQARFGFGDYTVVAVSERAEPDGLAGLHRAAVTAVEAVLGPPALVGGPSAQAHWRLPDRLVEVKGYAARKAARVTLSVRPREATEADEHSAAEWGEDWSPDPQWSVLPGGLGHDALRGRMFHPCRPATTWDAFESNVRSVFRSLAVDVPLLARYMHTVTWVVEPRVAVGDGDPPFVQGWFAADECHLEVWGDSGVITTSRNGVPGLTVEPGTAEHGLKLANLALGAVRGWGLADPQALRHRAWSAPKGVTLLDLGLGIGH